MVKESNTIAKVAKSTSIFFVGNVLAKIIVFLLLPIYTKYLSPESFGYYDLSITYISIATSILYFDIWVSTMRYMYEKSTIQWKNKAISSGIIIFSVSSVIYIVFAIILGFFKDIQYFGYITLFGLSTNIQNMYSFTTRGFGKNFEFAVSGIINTLVTVSVNVILIVWLYWDFSALYVAGIVGNFMQILYLEYKIRIFSNIQWKQYDTVLTTELFLYTLPLCLTSIAYWLLVSYNKIVINDLMSTSYNGIYAIGNKFTFLISFVASCFTFAWQDVSFLRGNDTGEFFSKASRLYLIFLGAGTILLIPVCNVIFPIIVDEAYWLAKGTLPLFLIWAVVSSYSTFISNIFYAIKDTKTIFISMAASSILNLALCHTFINLWGLNGANLSIIVSFVLDIIIRCFILSRKIKFSFDIKSTLLLAVGIAASTFVFENGTATTNIGWILVSGVGILLVFRDDAKLVLSSLAGKARLTQ